MQAVIVTGAQDPQRDLTAVGNQNLPEERFSSHLA